MKNHDHGITSLCFDTKRRWWHDVHKVTLFLTQVIRCFWAFRDTGRNCVTVFGSARFPSSHPHYKLGVQLGTALVKAGYYVMTGGGPGIMEAANRGARKGKGLSLGCTIHLPHEQKANKYIDRSVDTRYFFARKLALTRHACAFIAMPGGFGTLDELFEMVTLIQTEHMKNFPIVLIGKDFWKPMLQFLRKNCVEAGTIDAEEIQHLLFITDDIHEAITHINNTVQQGQA